MCGITGHWNFDGKIIDENNFKEFTKFNSFRGPDNRGHEFYLNHSLALGHTRLSIIDLTAMGAQPLSYFDSGLHIVFNGEIYNFQELKESLIKINYKFKSNTDTEVVLASYLNWGVECLNKFEGMFSFAIFDERNQILFCARDPFGIKPFYYNYSNKKFIFSSSIYSIHQYENFKFTLNNQSLQANLNFDMSFRPETMFNEIKSLEKGSYLIVNSYGKFINKKYYQLPVNQNKIYNNSNEVLEKLEYIFGESVKQQLMADVEVSTFMSGGIDSSLVTAFASIYKPRIKAFTLSFDKELIEFDELEEAIAAAKHFGVEHIIKKLQPEYFRERLNESIFFSDEPLGGVPPSFVLSEVVKEHQIKVVLNGLGGDELFAGYNRYRFREFEWFSTNNENLYQKLKRRVVKDNFNQTLSDYYCKSLSRFNPVEHFELFGEKQKKVFKDFYHTYNKEKIQFNDFVSGISYYDMQFYLGEYQLDGVDQLNMANSIEGRFPFLNTKLVELVSQMSSELKIQNTFGKLILKELAKKYLPKKVLQMSKKGFGVPNSFWFEDGTHGEILAKEKINNLLKRGIFNNTNKTQELMLKHRAKFVALEIWFEKFYGK
jgi:asparagine synthase (glutamine-hydrolysing)